MKYGNFSFCLSMQGKTFNIDNVFRRISWPELEIVKLDTFNFKLSMFNLERPTTLFNFIQTSWIDFIPYFND